MMGKSSSVLDPIFKLVKCEIISIPSTYVLHQIDPLNNNHFYYVNQLCIDNHTFTQDALKHGEHYSIKIFEVKKEVSSQVCIEFMRNHNCILLDLTALIILRELNRELFQIEHWTLLFSDKDTLYRDVAGNHRVPGIYRRSENEFALSLINSFEDGISLKGSPVSIICISKQS